MVSSEGQPVAAVATGCNSLVAQARYCNSIQLMHMSREDHAPSIDVESAMAAKEKTRNCYSTHNFASTVSFGM